MRSAVGITIELAARAELTLFDEPYWAGQVAAVLAMGGLAYHAIDAGAAAFTGTRVVTALAAAAPVGFLLSQARGAHPMVPLGLFRSGNISIAVAVGFAFIAATTGCRS
jgi:DHA2 family methylenomycin A resistance protein-like MFS transporter